MGTSALSTTVRYVLLAAIACVLAWVGFEQTKYLNNDFVIFLVGAYTLNHHHGPLTAFTDPRLHVYVDNPHIQIGPPALIIGALLGGLTALRMKFVITMGMALMSVGAIAAVDLAAHRRGDDRQATGYRLAMFLASGAVAGTWSIYAARWGHLDDPMAIALVAVAVAALSRTPQHGWLAAGCLGVAAATKPWAVIFAPLLFVLPRVRRAPAMLVLIASAAVWWLPFVISAPGTVRALGGLPITISPGSVMHLLGAGGTEVQKWLRPSQFILGGAVCAAVALRGRWTGAPLAAVAVRVLTDPYSYPYYGLGPLLFAYLYDATRPSTRRLPIWTVVTGVVEFAVPALFGHTAGAVAKLVWGLAVLALLLGPVARDRWRPGRVVADAG